MHVCTQLYFMFVSPQDVECLHEALLVRPRDLSIVPFAEMSTSLYDRTNVNKERKEDLGTK